MQSLMKTRLTALAVMLVVFVAGMAVGMVVDRGLAEEASGTAAVAEESEEDEERRRGRMIDQVSLTPEQQVRVDSLVADFRERMKTFHESSRKEYDHIVQDVRESIKGVLDDEQRARYEALLEERDRRRHN
jgi:Spy/CpxP family protein refolding chaperone